MRGAGGAVCGAGRRESRPVAAAVVGLCAALCAAAGLAAGGAAAARSAGAAGSPVAAGPATQPMPAAWLKACRASKAAPACPTRIQRSALWADPDHLFPPRVLTQLGATSYLVYADARLDGDVPVCAPDFDGVTRDYSRMTPACHARYAPEKGLVAWFSITAGPILDTVHVEWKTRKRKAAKVMDGVAAAHGAIPLDFGPQTWDGRAGRLLLGPHGFSEELVFVWGEGRAQRGVGIQVFEPLTQAVALLRRMVASVPQG